MVTSEVQHPVNDGLRNTNILGVEGRPAVKLSDNPTKATGPAEEVAYYRSVFGAEGLAELPVTV